jgi:hypothetical protein
MAKKRTKQKYLDGMEPPDIPDLTAATEKYHEAKTDRMRLSEAETTAQANLVNKLVGQDQAAERREQRGGRR